MLKIWLIRRAQRWVCHQKLRLGFPSRKPALAYHPARAIQHLKPRRSQPRHFQHDRTTTQNIRRNRAMLQMHGRTQLQPDLLPDAANRAIPALLAMRDFGKSRGDLGIAWQQNPHFYLIVIV